MADRVVVGLTLARRPGKGTAALLRRVAHQVLVRQGVTGVEVGVLVCGDHRMSALNRAYRAVDQPTDVLAFPAREAQPDGGTYLGDIAISLDTARRQAAERGVDEGRELATLLLHGLLHLLGHDHERDHGEMAALEAALRTELGL